MTEKQQAVNEKERGGCLTVFLVVMMFITFLQGIYLLIDVLVRPILWPEFPRIVVLFVCLLAFANVVFTIAIWRWKRWGVYGFGIGFLVVSVFFGYKAGVVAAVLGGLFYIVPFIVLVRRVWNQMV